ncbi:hypothetical protein AC579_7978 [Pseudocercospora musae]|uniref:Uncharacterized protein n=1 Tax=Pseudocercospora musae TaxID=113226 RepID=A0A139I052_9PEZI|nr:hypothetical protein AC579_7978 [Pseudocercospora musae]
MSSLELVKIESSSGRKLEYATSSARGGRAGPPDGANDDGVGRVGDGDGDVSARGMMLQEIPATGTASVRSRISCGASRAASVAAYLVYSPHAAPRTMNYGKQPGNLPSETPFPFPSLPSQINAHGKLLVW